MTLREKLDALDAEMRDLRAGSWTETAARIAMPLAPTLSAIARAAMARPWWRDGYEDERGAEVARCEGCQLDLDGDRRHSACHDIECRYLALDCALDAAEGTT